MKIQEYFVNKTPMKISTFYLKHNTNNRPFLIQSFDYGCLKQFVTRLYRVTDGVAIQLPHFSGKLNCRLGPERWGQFFVKLGNYMKYFVSNATKWINTG